MWRAVTRFRTLELGVLLVSIGAAAYEAAVAFEWIPVGTDPGENARFLPVSLVGIGK